MVQFNLLPDVKLEYVKARRTKYLLTFVSVIVGAVALTVLLFSLFIVHVVQKKSLNDLQKDITAYSTELKDTKDLSKILTVQNQLNTLGELHNAKPVTSRIFDYISQLTPSQASLDKLSIDFDQGSLTIGGSAPTLDTVSLYTDTLKATRFTIEGDEANEQKKAFSEVVLSSFTRDDKGAKFTITVKFDSDLFDATKKVILVVPSNAEADQTNVFETGN